MLIAKDFVLDKNKDERVVKSIWPHPIVFIKIILAGLALLALPAVAIYLVHYIYPQIAENQTVVIFAVLAGFLYYLYVLMFTLFVWMVNYLSFWTITTHRIISRRQNGLFSRTVSELELYRVQDITAEQKGFLATLFDYGDLFIQTAGEEERFLFKNFGNPTGVSRLIQKLDEEAKQKFNRSSV